MKLLLTLAISAAAVLAQAPPPAKSPAKSPAKTAAPAAAAKSGAATKAGAATAAARTAPAQYSVKFTTTKGDFTVEVHRDWAPLGADRFYSLVRSRFFTNASFFRVVPNFIVQFGLAANPAANKAWEKPIKDDPVKQHNTRGTLVFATAGPGTRTTQLFINLKDNSGSLDGLGFAPFGTVTEGMDIVDQLYSGYGDDPGMGGHGPRQELVTKEGKPYLDKNFPKLDSIKTATVIAPESAAPATKGAPAATKTAPKAAPKGTIAEPKGAAAPPKK